MSISVFYENLYDGAKATGLQIEDMLRRLRDAAARRKQSVHLRRRQEGLRMRRWERIYPYRGNPAQASGKELSGKPDC